MELTLHFLGEPFAQQSGRIVQIHGRPRLIKQKNAVTGQASVRAQAVSQLPPGFEPFLGPLAIRVTFHFGPLKGFTKKQIAILESGETIPKTTKPDLIDNLMKGLSDALTGIVWMDDAQIIRLRSEKAYARQPKTVVVVEKL
jgi:Holliday junction resolvase RusA-like endonuclease